MAIERLSFPNTLQLRGGVEINPRGDTRLETKRLIIKHFASLQTLAPGEYDLTPGIWTKNASVHNLLVLENGTAIYRMIPKFPKTINIETKRPGVTSIRGGGRVFRIPEDVPMIFIAGPAENYSGIRLFEVVLHIP